MRILLAIILTGFCSTAWAQNGFRMRSRGGQPVQNVQRYVPSSQSVTSGNGYVVRPAGSVPAGVSGGVVEGGYSSQVIPASATLPAAAQSEVNIVGELTSSGLPFSHTPGATALEKANHERRLRGQGPLIPDPALQQLALTKATIAAQRGNKNHIGGSLGGARAEGVGHTNGRFLSCCLDMPATYGGAAMVKGRDGWYCCLLVR
jgi:uncharacterized protein YkwD